MPRCFIPVKKMQKDNVELKISKAEVPRYCLNSSKTEGMSHEIVESSYLSVLIEMRSFRILNAAASSNIKSEPSFKHKLLNTVSRYSSSSSLASP